MIGFYDYTVILTYLSLLSAVTGIGLAVAHHPLLAILCLMFSGLCDMFDGRVARTKKNRTAEQKGFGIQIDSLCDIVAFGILPAVITIVVCGSVWYAVLIAALYVLAGAHSPCLFQRDGGAAPAGDGRVPQDLHGPSHHLSRAHFPVFLRCFLDIFQRAAILHGALLVVMALTGASFVMPFHIRKPRSKEQWALLGIGLVIAAGCIFVWVRFRMRIVR